MDKLIELTEELKKELDELPLFIEYKRVKEEFENSKEIQDLKREIVRAKNENRIEDHKALLEKYNSHPLVINYLNLEDEVRQYLKEISEILNKK